MITKKTLSLLLAVIMIAMTFTTFPLTANAVDVDAAATAVDPENIFQVSNADELKNAKDTINSSGAGEYVIELKDNISSTIGGIDIKGTGITVTVIGNDHYLACSRGQNVQAWYGATVILGDGKSELTLIGGDSGSEPGPVHIFGDDSVCYMNEKVTIKDNKCNNLLGGGVSVVSGTFIMNGGTIEDCGIEGGSVCYGGGVAVYNAGYFEMNGGTITGCYARSDYIDEYDPNRCFTAQGGGVFVSDVSVFTMNGGTICNCEATNFGGGVAMDITYNEMQNYGMGNPKSNVTINGGTITGNQAECGGGVFASGYFYSYAGVFYGYLPSGSAPSNPGLIINGGEISKNTANDAGGGVFIAMLRSSIKSQIHNAYIIGNHANNGAGIESFGYWTQMDIDGCTISNNTAVTNGGGILLSGNSSGGYTNLKNSTITDNISGDRGAGVYYDTNSKLNISGANIIQNNTYNGKQNNLNILSQEKPVYVNGNLTGSQIGLSDPTLWDDNKTDEDESAVSTNYLTSGFKTYNSEHPANYFTSDHETWSADFSNVNANEVRLTRGAVVDYYINNNDISEATYEGKDLFTKYVTELAHKVRVGDKIEAFYAIPQHDTNYIFKGWYYDRENNNDSRPVQFGKDKYLPNKNIYAHWIKVEDVAKDENDLSMLQSGEITYGGFDLAGVQIRKEMRDYNFDDKPKMPGGLRFITSLSMDVINQINAIKPNNIEYGYVAATHEGWINYHKGHEKLQYVSTSANGIDTSSENATNENYFGFAHNVKCTSRIANSQNNEVRVDHQNFGNYLLYSFVVTYEGDDAARKDTNVLARPYIHYTDANGLERVAYSEYTGTNVLGGCYTNYNTVAAMAGN